MATQRTPTKWSPQPSGTVTTDNSAVQRKEQDGTVRKEQDGTVRVLQPNVVNRKTPATWAEVSS